MILVEKPTEDTLKSLSVISWPIWECDPSVFDWYYDAQEMCYLLEGKVTVRAAEQTVTFGKGDFVTFPAGLSCEWTVHEHVRKHYQFG